MAWQDKAEEEEIVICKDRNVLRYYLLNREKEVVTIMMSLFDEEQIMKSFIKSEKYDLAREKATLVLRDGKNTIDDISIYFLELFESDIKELEAEDMQLA